jgi:hypothetical protein
MVSISFGNADGTPAKLPHTILRDGAFRPPIRTVEETQPLSRLPYTSYSIPACPSLIADLARQVPVAFREINDAPLSAEHPLVGRVERDGTFIPHLQPRLDERLYVGAETQPAQPGYTPALDALLPALTPLMRIQRDACRSDSHGLLTRTNLLPTLTPLGVRTANSARTTALVSLPRNTQDPRVAAPAQATQTTRCHAGLSSNTHLRAQEHAPPLFRARSDAFSHSTPSTNTSTQSVDSPVERSSHHFHPPAVPRVLTGALQSSAAYMPVDGVRATLTLAPSLLSGEYVRPAGPLKSLE